MAKNIETLQLLTLADLDQAVRVQARAFQDDPLWCYLVPDPKRRANLLLKFSRPLFRFGILNGQAYGVGSPTEGVAVWSSPQQVVKFSSILRSGFQSFLFSPIVFQFIRARGIFARFESMQKRYAPEPHYYLQTISVMPEAQGKGLASKLIRPFLERADAEGVTTYTETMTPENVGLYEHYGFKVMEEYRVPDTDLRLWAFYRPLNRKMGSETNTPLKR